MVSVLIVDDSAFIRRSLSMLLEKDPDISVVAMAKNGKEAIELAKQHDPDVITLDVEMPQMDGLTALKHIMEQSPCPVIMISSLTSEGAETTLKAMELGALDFFLKQGSSSIADFSSIGAELCAKIKTLARRKVFIKLRHQQKLHQNNAARTTSATTFAPSSSTVRSSTVKPPAPFTYKGRAPFDVIAIGVSTGGPPAIQTVLSALPGNLPVPILVAQHMPATFTGAFANRLNGQCALEVKEANGTEEIRNGTVYISPGGKHLRLENRKSRLFAYVTEEPQDALYKPSANVLIETVAKAVGSRALAIILTGMGSDGAEGVKELKARGGKAIAQSEASCVVYGMPKAIVDNQLADEILDINDIAKAILNYFQ